MAVLVHARFDDDLELNNGVATLTVNPDPDTSALMEVNAQDGAVSVTNATADDDARPEITRVVRADGELTIERTAASSIVAPAQVLDDDTLRSLFDQLLAVATTWLDRANGILPAAQQRSTLTLDFEFRTVAEGWPARADGTVEPSRLVVKQARSLDPGLRQVPASLLELPIPRDVLAHAVRIEEVTCSAGDEEAVGYRVFTDPLARIDFGHSVEPLTVWTSATATPAATPPDDPLDCIEVEVLTTPRRYLLDLLADR
jgi:hypothetical protein